MPDDSTPGVGPGKRLLAYLLVPGLLAVNAVFFETVLGRSYSGWYLAEGALVSLSTSFVATVWDDLEGLTEGLVSANPLEYYGTCLQIAGLSFQSMGNHLETGEYAGSGAELDLAGIVVHLWDSFVSVGLLLVVAGSVLAWVAVVAPMNYLVTLVSGAPARQGLRNPDRGVVVAVRDRSDPSRADEPFRSRSEALEAGWIDVTFARKPFAVTQLLTALVLALAGVV